MAEKTVTHKALLIIQSHINAQMEALGHAYVFLKEMFSSIETSNVYLKYLEGHRGPTARGQLIVAVSIETPFSAPEINAKLQERMRKNPNSVDYFLVLFEDETLLTPQLTLPHPDLHLLPFWLVPAAELWGDAAHPVLGKSLHDLAAERDLGTWGEFYAQGKTLLDFYYKQRK
jgi:7,8-dihydro-6-hydroxymethylpterin-pyrophosphokinase